MYGSSGRRMRRPEQHQLHKPHVRHPLWGACAPGTTDCLRSSLLGLAEDHEAVDADQADGEHAERPPRVRPAHVQQRTQRAQGGRDEPDHAPVDVAREQRKGPGQLNDAEDDRDPPPRMQARETNCVSFAQKLAFPTAAIP